MALSFEQFKALRAKGLSTSQISQFESGVSPRTKMVEGKIAEREPIKFSLPKPPTSRKEALMKSLFPIANVPEAFTGIVSPALRTEEAALASPMLDISRGEKLSTLVKNLGQAVKGQRPVEFGDVPRQLGAPEPVAATIGFGAGLVAPSGVGIGKAIGAAAKPSVVKTTAKIGKLTEKAEKLTHELLQYPTKEVSTAIERGVPFKPAIEAARAMPKAKSYQEITKRFDGVIDESEREIDKIIKTNNKTMTREFMKPLYAERNSLVQSGLYKPNQIKAYSDVLDRMNDVVNKAYTKGKWDRVDAQDLKKELGKHVAKLRDKIARGAQLTAEEAAEDQALDIARRGLREVIEKGTGGKEVARLNQIAGGLIESKTAAAGQQARFLATKQPGIIERTGRAIGSMIGRRPGAQAAGFVREVTTTPGSLQKRTGQIQKFMQKAEKLRAGKPSLKKKAALATLTAAIRAAGVQS